MSTCNSYSLRTKYFTDYWVLCNRLLYNCKVLLGKISTHRIGQKNIFSFPEHQYFSLQAFSIYLHFGLQSALCMIGNSIHPIHYYRNCWSAVAKVEKGAPYAKKLREDYGLTAFAVPLWSRASVKQNGNVVPSSSLFLYIWQLSYVYISWCIFSLLFILGLVVMCEISSLGEVSEEGVGIFVLLKACEVCYCPRVHLIL